MEEYSKLEEMFLPYVKTWDCYNDEPVEENNTKKCVDLAKRIAIDFSMFCQDYQYSVIFDRWSKLVGSSGHITKEELFDKFIVDYERTSGEI